MWAGVYHQIIDRLLITAGLEQCTVVRNRLEWSRVVALALASRVALMADPMPQSAGAGVIRAIYLADRAGREMTDTEVRVEICAVLMRDSLVATRCMWYILRPGRIFRDTSTAICWVFCKALLDSFLQSRTNQTIHTSCNPFGGSSRASKPPLIV